MNGAAGQSLQQRIEDSVPGRALISLLIVFTLLAVVVINLPDSSLRRSLSKTTQPYLNAIGLDQAWGVFAPDPRRESIRLEVRLGYADGTTEVWKAPERGDLIGGYSDYRWRKFEENLINEGAGEGASAEQLARWVIREERKRSAPPTTAVVVSGKSVLAPPGPDADKPASYSEEQLLNLDVTPAMLKEPK